MVLACAPPPMTPVPCVGCSGGVVVLLRGGVEDSALFRDPSNVQRAGLGADGERRGRFLSRTCARGWDPTTLVHPAVRSKRGAEGRAGASGALAGGSSAASDADSSHRAGGRKKRRERTSGIGRGERTRGRSHLAAPRSGAFVTSPRSRERGFARARLRPGRLTVQHRTPPAREVSRGCWVERSRKRFFHSGSPLAAAAVLGFLTRALRIRHPNSWQIFWKKPKTKMHTTARKEIRRDLRDIVPRAEAEGRAGERRSVFVRSWLSSTDRESRASRVHDPPLAQRTRFPRSARRSDPIRRAIRWRTRRTRLSAPSARGRRATPHRG